MKKIKKKKSSNDLKNEVTPEMKKLNKAGIPAKLRQVKGTMY